MNNSFSTNAKGEIDGLSAPLEPTVKDIVFKRIPPGEMMDKAFLEQFTGQYALVGLPMTITVALKGEHALALAITGQPNYELVPHKGTEFRVKGLSGFSIEFTRDEAADMVATMVQPGAVLTAKKQVS